VPVHPLVQILMKRERASSLAGTRRRINVLLPPNLRGRGAPHVRGVAFNLELLVVTAAAV